MRRNYFLIVFTLPLICFNILKMASIEVKFILSLSQTRILKQASGSDLTCSRVRSMLPIFAHFLPNQILLLIIKILTVSAIKMVLKVKS